jgi:hypothetical protein
MSITGLGIFEWVFISVTLLMIIIYFFHRRIIPLFFRNKWERKRIRILMNKKLSLVEIMDKYKEIQKLMDKEQKRKLRLDKLKKLN